MGLQPSFPTNEQWEKHKSEQVQKLNEKLNQLNIEENADSTNLIMPFNNMIGECYDKGRFRKFFTNGRECTEARGVFLMAVSKYAKSSELKETIQSEMRKYK